MSDPVVAGQDLARAAQRLGYELALADIADRPYVRRRRPRVKGSERELFVAIKAFLRAHDLPSDDQNQTLVLEQLGLKHE